ncbi:MAG: Low temperature requirement protein LtrA [Chloroflexi bacterium]|nr:MAG: Low temperature requirement protein LtrA [Chloroflexota bacterium]
MHAPGGQTVTFVELFFDLVFVFALTEITSFTAEHLDAGGVARAVLILWFVWWGWSQWTWALNSADTDHGGIRLVTLLATAIAFLMAVSVADAFHDGGGGWFVLPYVGVRALGLMLYARVATERDGHLTPVLLFAGTSSAGLLAALIGGFVDADARVWWWLAAAVLELAAAGVSAKSEQWHLHVPHFTERHGLIVIIALGESLIVAAAGVAGAERSNELMAVAIGALVVTCLMWWTYFGWFREGLEVRFREAQGSAQSLFARDVYSLLHLLLVAGIVAMAVGFEEMVHHPNDPVAPEVLGALGVGAGLFLGASALAWARARRKLLWVRLIAPAGLAPLLVVATDLAPWLVLTLVALAFACVVVVEEIRPPDAEVPPDADVEAPPIEHAEHD